MKFGYLILRKIIKFVTTRSQILRLKCTKFDFGRGKGEGMLDFDMCPGAPVFLVTPLLGACAVARRPASARVAFISRCRPSRVVARLTDDE